MEIGSVTSTPGAIESGWFDVATLPTGSSERLPVMIADGEGDGPTLWLTAGLHGDEVTGIAAAQDVMGGGLVDDLRGTVVCIPILNPAGVRQASRTSYYHDEDPNRYFPVDSDGEGPPPLVQELIDERVFERFAETADALVSLHSAWINERIFTIVERVRYGGDRSEREAASLASETVGLADAFGLPAVREYDVDIQESYGLERSFEASALNTAGVPAITPELGSPQVVEARPRKAAIAGVRNVLRALDMLPGEPTENEYAPAPPVDYPVKRIVGPTAPVAGIVRHHVAAGDVVHPGTPIADIVSPHGRSKVTVESSHEGYVLGRREGIAVYENDPLVSTVARDDGALAVEAD